MSFSYNYGAAGLPLLTTILAREDGLFIMERCPAKHAGGAKERRGETTRAAFTTSEGKIHSQRGLPWSTSIE